VSLEGEALLAYLDGAEGDFGAAGRLEALADRFRVSGYPWHELNARYWLGVLLASRCSPQARAELERARDLARSLPIQILEEDCIEALATLGP